MIEREFSVGESVSVKVAIRSGRVAVETGEPGLVSVSVDTHDPTFDVRQRGGAIVAWGERGGRSYVTMRVPPLTDVEASTASGDVSIVPRLGRLEVASASGDIAFDSVRRLQAKTGSGSVRGNTVEGEARCITASGDIRIAQLLERADLSTASGDITVERCAGVISCATLSGDIRVGELTGPSLSVKSMSGGVRIGIPSRTRVNLDANTFSGRVVLPAPNPSPEPPEREITARVRLVSGDLRIDRAD